MFNNMSIGKYIIVGVISATSLFGAFFMGMVYTMGHLEWVEGKYYDVGCITLKK